MFKEGNHLHVKTDVNAGAKDFDKNLRKNRANDTFKIHATGKDGVLALNQYNTPLAVHPRSFLALGAPLEIR